MAFHGSWDLVLLNDESTYPGGYPVPSDAIHLLRQASGYGAIAPVRGACYGDRRILNGNCGKVALEPEKDQGTGYGFVSLGIGSLAGGGYDSHVKQHQSRRCFV